MSWVEESRELRISPLPTEGLVRLADQLGEPVEVVRPLHGGVASSVYELRSPTRRFVLKRFRPSAPESAQLEWERLEVAMSVPVPTPEPIVLDLAGRWFGVAALLVSYLEGEPMYPPLPELLGRVLADVHATSVPVPSPTVLIRPALWKVWQEPAPSIGFPPGLSEAVCRLAVVAVAESPVLCHGDFHPGNVLIDGGVVSGVVDWSGTRLTPAGFDIGLARCDLAIEPGGNAPDIFLAAYQEAGGRDIPHLGLWDALAAARALEQGHGWVEAWTDMGVPMSAERIQSRAREFAQSALVRASG